MALIRAARTAQYPLSMELVLNFDDTFVAVSGATAGPAAGLMANVDLNAFPLPPNAIVVGGEVSVETAFAGPTAATLSVGDANSATRHANAVDLKTAGRTALTLTNYVNSAGDNLQLRFNTTVAVATAGKVAVRVLYVVRGRANESQIS